MHTNCALCGEIIAVGKSFKLLGSSYCEKCIKAARSQRAKVLSEWKNKENMERQREEKKRSREEQNTKRKEEKRRQEEERRTEELQQRMLESQEYSLDYFRRNIEADGLEQFTIKANIGLKLKRNEKLYYIGGDSHAMNTKVKIIVSNQRLFYAAYSHPIENLRNFDESVRIKEGMLSKPLTSIISLEPPYTSEDYLIWHTRLHFDNGKSILLPFNSVHAVRIFYTILSELIDRLNDPIQEECLMPERQRITDEAKISVWRRDGGVCVKCGSRENLEFDHIIPVSKGGSNTTRNIELLC